MAKKNKGCSFSFVGFCLICIIIGGFVLFFAFAAIANFFKTSSVPAKIGFCFCAVLVIAVIFLIAFRKKIIKYIKQKKAEREAAKWEQYKREYYSSEAFLSLKNSIAEYVRECNELNQHIEDLKNKHITDNFSAYSCTTEINANTGNWNYQRKALENYKQANDTTYFCSLAVLKGAREQPFAYLCKYFDIKADESTLEKLEDMLNDFMSVEQGIQFLQEKKNEILYSHTAEIPQPIRERDYLNFQRQLNFVDVDINPYYQKQYKFSYVSAGGNSAQEQIITFDVPTLTDFITYISEKIKFKQSAQGQRRLMTPALREEIKARDNYTCCYCGISTRQEPHLLLEIDHIVPVAKGGMTTESNLQTLCWKCNRSKGAKV